MYTSQQFQQTELLLLRQSPRVNVLFTTRITSVHDFTMLGQAYLLCSCKNVTVLDSGYFETKPNWLTHHEDTTETHSDFNGSP